MMPLSKELTKLTGKYNQWDIFSDFVEMAAIAISNSVDKAQFDVREARYLAIAKRYTQNELGQFAKCLAVLVDEMENTGGDILGRCFSELEVHNKYRGQFFTPYEVCRLMASINLRKNSLDEIIARQGYVSMCEPTCGAGAMVLAYAEEFHNAGYHPQQQLHVTAQDIDTRAVHMAYLQLALRHIPAIIILGDTLRMEQREVWYTPAHIMGGWSWRLSRNEREREAVEQAVSLETPIPEAAPAQSEAETVADTLPTIDLLAQANERGQLLLF